MTQGGDWLVVGRGAGGVVLLVSGVGGPGDRGTLRQTFRKSLLPYVMSVSPVWES